MVVSSDRPIGVRKRLAVLVVLAAAGGLAFLPFLAADSGKAIDELLGFPVAVTLIAGLAAWPGLARRTRSAA